MRQPCRSASIATPAGRASRDYATGARRKPKFHPRRSGKQESVVQFVPDDTELGQRIADGKALDDFSDELWVVPQDVRVLFQHGRTGPRLNQAGARKFVDERRRVVLRRECRELQNAGVK